MIKTLDHLLLLSIPLIRDVFLSVMEQLVDRSVIKEMEEAIKANDVERLYVASGFTPALLNPIIREIQNVYENTGILFFNKFPKKNKAVFNIRNPIVEDDIEKYSSSLITNLTDEMRENVRFELRRGYEEGNNPRQTALNIVGRVDFLTGKRIGGTIGLSNNQLKWSANAKKYLQTLDERYLNLKLRDKRFDSIVKKAILERKPLKSDYIDKLIIAYNSKALKFRGTSISITESNKAVNKAEHASILQSIDEGFLKEDQVTKWWDDTRDIKTRKTHVELGKKYNRKNAIPFNTPFVSDSKKFQMMYPTDVSLGAPIREIIGCRCKAVYRIDFLKV